MDMARDCIFFALLYLLRYPWAMTLQTCLSLPLLPSSIPFLRNPVDCVVSINSDWIPSLHIHCHHTDSSSSPLWTGFSGLPNPEPFSAVSGLAENAAPGRCFHIKGLGPQTGDWWTEEQRPSGILGTNLTALLSPIFYLPAQSSCYTLIKHWLKKKKSMESKLCLPEAIPLKSRTLGASCDSRTQGVEC